MVVRPCVEYLLVPYYAAVGGLDECVSIRAFTQPRPRARGTYRDVDKLEPVRVPHQIVGENNGALEPRVGPFGPVRIGDVQASDGDGLDLVGVLGHHALDRLLVLLAQYGRHCGGGGRRCCGGGGGVCSQDEAMTAESPADLTFWCGLAISRQRKGALLRRWSWRPRRREQNGGWGFEGAKLGRTKACAIGTRALFVGEWWSPVTVTARAVVGAYLRVNLVAKLVGSNTGCVRLGWQSTNARVGVLVSLALAL